MNAPILALVLRISLIMTMALSMSSPCAAGAESPQIKKEYTFAVIPQTPPEVMHRNWLPFIDRLSRDTGLTLKLKVYENMDDFEDDLKEGNVDFAFMNSVQVVMAWHEHGYLPLVRSREPIRGCIFVRKDSKIEKREELEGKEIALIGTHNVCSVVIRHDARDLNIKAHYAGSQSNVFKYVEIGETAAGGTLDITFEKDQARMDREFRRIYTTEPLSSAPIAVHPSVALDVRILITKMVLNYRECKDGQDLLKGIGLQYPVTADYERDYKPLEKRLAVRTPTER